MADSLKFVVEINADQVAGELNSVVAAVNKAGGSIRSSLGGGSKAAANDLMEMKKSAGQARETMMFLTNSLGQFGPAGQAAQSVITGIGGAIMGGGGLLLAIEGLRLVFQYLSQDVSTSNKAMEEFDAKTKQTMEEAKKRIAGLQAQLVGVKYGEAAKKVAEYREDLKRLNDEIEKEKEAAGGGTSARLEELKKQRNDLLLSLRDELQLMKELKAAEEAKDAAAKRAAATEKQRSDRAKTRAQSQTGAAGTSGYEEDGARMADYYALKAKDYAEAQAAYNKELEQSTQLAQQWGAAVGDVFAQLAMGQMSAEEATRSILQMLIKEATAAAITSAIEAGKSQAGTPVVGPVLAISAMGAMLAATMGLVGNIPSARGGWWDTGSYEGLAMLHKREMVVPAREAEQLRRGAGAGVTINVAAYDGRGFDRVLSNNSSALSRELRRMQRRGGA